METINIILYALVLILSSFYLLLKHRYLYWENRGVSCIKPVLLYGNLKGIGKTKHSFELFENIYNEFKGKAQFAGAYFFINPVIIGIDLDFIKNVLIRDFNNFSSRGIDYNEKDDPLSAHLFSLDGPKWKILRAKLTPTFTSGKMKFMFNTVVDVAKEFEKTLREILIKDNEIEMKDLSARFTTDVIGTCAFGIECNSLTDPNIDFRVISRSVFENPKNTRILRAIKSQFPFLVKLFKITSIRKNVTDFFMGVVRETVEYREKNNVRRNDFMDLLIQLKNNETLEDTKGEKLGKLSLEEIAAQAFIFFLAGFETSSTTMGYALYELALNPDIQEKARKEIYEVLEKHKELTYEAILEMTYINEIINETLRKYPPVTALFRKAVNDYKVPNSNHVIEKGKIVFIPVYAIHRDPKIYPDPEKFDPERFSPENMKNRQPISFLGFGDGPRNCIGLRFGQMQARVGLVTLLKNFKFTACTKTEVPLKFSLINPILSPQNGIWLTVENI